jgi:hypothetical protein
MNAIAALGTVRYDLAALVSLIFTDCKRAPQLLRVKVSGSTRDLESILSLTSRLDTCKIA